MQRAEVPQEIEMPQETNVTVVTIAAAMAHVGSFLDMRTLTSRVTASSRRVAGSPSSGRSKNTHAVWNIPLQPAVWEGLPPKSWQSDSTPFTHKSEPTPAASTKPAVRFPKANAA